MHIPWTEDPPSRGIDVVVLAVTLTRTNFEEETEGTWATSSTLPCHLYPWCEATSCQSSQEVTILTYTVENGFGWHTRFTPKKVGPHGILKCLRQPCHEIRWTLKHR
jgi:hypothetical protein